MNVRTAKLFRALMDNGYIEKENDEELFSYYYDDEVSDDLAMLQREFEFRLFKTPRRIYLIPDQSNELFLQNNADYRRSVGSDAKIYDIYLYNYLAVFILHSMYGGKGNNLETREMFVVSDMIREFSEHCRRIREEEQEYEHASEKYSIEFCRLAAAWLSKRNFMQWASHTDTDVNSKSAGRAAREITSCLSLSRTLHGVSANTLTFRLLKIIPLSFTADLSQT